ncbi:Uracil permease [compost metagenome]
MLLATVVLVVGLSGTTLTLGTVELKGMALATIVGILLSLLFKLFEVLRISNDLEESESSH